MTYRVLPPTRTIFLIIVLLMIVTFLPVVRAQPPPPPPDPEADWNPPAPSGSEQGMHRYITLIVGPGGSGAAAAWMTDYAYNRKTDFKGSESLYLWIVSPYSCYFFWWYEYYPPGTVPQGQWMVWANGPLSGGVYIIGPLSPEPDEPIGPHTERVWMMDCATGAFAHANARWNYGKDPTVIPTTAALTVSQTEINPGQQVSVSASISPVPSGGTLTISLSQNGGQWTSIQSGSATSGSLMATWTPTDPGTYNFKATYSGFTDAATNKQYSTSESPASPLHVEIIPTSISLSASKTEYAIDPQTLTAVVQVSGSVTPTGSLSSSPISNVPILLTYTSTQSTTSKTVTTDSSGQFTDQTKITSVKSAVKDDYTVVASWQGDSKHKGATSSQVSFSVTKIVVKVAELTLDHSQITRDLLLGASTVTVDGRLTPAVENTQVSISVKIPDGKPITDTVQTGTDGSFSWSFKPNHDGIYKISVAYAGDDQHATSSSQQMSLEVTPGYATLAAIIAVVLIAVFLALWRRGMLPIGRGSISQPPTPGAGTRPFSSGMVCPTCGLANRPGAIFCTNDRTRLGPTRTARATTAGMTVQAGGIACSKCGILNRPGATFCKHCRANLR